MDILFDFSEITQLTSIKTIQYKYILKLNLEIITYSTFEAVKNTNPYMAKDEANNILLLLIHILRSTKN